jgi:hypothetical protein
MSDYDDALALVRATHRQTRPVTPFEPSMPCDYEPCSREAAYLTELVPADIRLGACDEHITRLIEIVDRRLTDSDKFAADVVEEMNRRRVKDSKYIAIAAISGLLILALLSIGVGISRADDGIDRTICSRLALGDSPGQVMDELRHGDSRWNGPRAPGRIWEVLPNCPDD